MEFIYNEYKKLKDFLLKLNFDIYNIFILNNMYMLKCYGSFFYCFFMYF